MSIIGQPDSYSEMLQRIFWITVAAGVLCSLILADASPEVKTLMESVATEADIGPFKGLKALYVLIPLLIALISRVVLLHDKLSDLLRLRLHFDTRYILYPIAEKVGFDLSTELKNAIRGKRNQAMYAVFYPYAGFQDPKIDKQLVRTALDKWGWFWAAVEASFLLILTVGCLIFLNKWTTAAVCAGMVAFLLLFIFYQWFVCRGSAERQVEAILNNPERQTAIRHYFKTI